MPYDVDSSDNTTLSTEHALKVVPCVSERPCKGLRLYYIVGSHLLEELGSPTTTIAGRATYRADAL